MVEINKGIEAFDDTTDFTRNNKDRKPFGKSDSAASLHTDDFSVQPAPPTTEAPVTQPVKFTHKLADGTQLEAASVEELAKQIEQRFQQAPLPPAATEFEDKALYEPVEYKPRQLSLQEQADILNLWKEDPQTAMRKLQEAELGAPLDTIVKRLGRAEQLELVRRQEEAGVEFIGENEAYNPTRANAKKITEYLASKGKPITKQNLTVAFRQLVAAGDTGLVRNAPPVDDGSTEVPPPPTMVPSGTGRSAAPAQPTVDAAKFASLSLKEQQEYFQRLKRVQ